MEISCQFFLPLEEDKKVESRYIKNFSSITEEEQYNLGKKKVLVVGAGGLGGHVLDQLVRLGFKFIRVVDFDIFSETNLNRQLFCNEKTLGLSKVTVAKKYLKKINPNAKIEIFPWHLGPENIDYLLSNIEIIFDCTDNMETKLFLEKKAIERDIPLIYGSIGGFFGYGALIYKTPLLKKFYNISKKGIETDVGNLATTVSMVSSIQVSLAIKVSFEDFSFANKLFYCDLDSFDFHWIDIKK